MAKQVIAWTRPWGLCRVGVRVWLAILSVGHTNARAGRIPHMDAIANVSAALQPATNASSTEIASQLSAAAIDADEGIAKQMLATLLRSQVRRSDERFQSQLGVLADVFLTLRSMALADDLTNLYNRRGFLRAGTRLLNAVSRDKRGAQLFYIDVDGLKSINDSAGHAAGD